jgi:hypothetical protein
VIAALRSCFFREESIALELFGAPRDQALENQSIASKAQLSQRAFENGERTSPEEHPGTPREVAKLYLAHMPFKPRDRFRAWQPALARRLRPLP